MAARQFRTTVDPRTVGVLVTADSGFTTLTLNVVGTNTLPQTYPYTLVIDPDTASEEIVTVTAGSSNILTVARAQDNTTLKEHSVGAAVRHMVTARDLQEPQEHMVATGRYLDSISGSYYDPHGLGTGHGAFVGTTKTQELTNKTITGAALSGTTTNGGTITGGTINASSVPASGITGTTLPSAITTATGLAITESQVTNLVSDLTAKAPLAGPTFTGTVTIPTGAQITNPTIAGGTLTGTLNGGTVSPTTVSATTISVPFGGTISVASGGTFAVGGAGNVTSNGATISAAALGYVANATSNIQNQLNSITDAWIAYVPTFGGTGSPTLGNGTMVAAYKAIGKTVHIRISITFGSSSSFGTAGLTLSTPASFTPAFSGVGQCISTNSSDRYPGQVVISTSGVLIPLTSPAASATVAGPARNVYNTVPFSWGNTDQLLISGIYEVA